MPYKEHPVFEKPEDENVAIWRYLDFTKFVSLLDRRALFFVRADKIAELDPFEGMYTKFNIAIDNLRFEDIPHAVLNKKGIKDKVVFDGLRTAQINLREHVKNTRHLIIINSWNISGHESAAMWKIYLKSDEGVAIQSTYKKLCKSLKAHADDEIYIGKVKYIDYESDIIPYGNSLAPFLYKRKSFEYEQELRALIGKSPQTKGGLDWSRELFEFGQYVSVDLEILLDKIFVSPTAPQWFYELVVSMTDKYDIDVEVKQSSLAEPEFY